MAIFTNKLLSKEGQKERLTNVVQTLKAAVTGQGVQANTKSEAANKVLSTLASNPFTTATVAAVVAAPATALTAVKTAPKTTIATTLLTPAVVSVVATAPKETTKAITEAPSNIAQFSGNVAGLVTDPSVQGLKDLAKENPVLTAATAAAATYVVGKTISSAATNIANTIATKENTQAIKDIAKTTGSEMVLPSNNLVSNTDKPIEPQLVNVSRSVVGTKRKSTSKNSLSTFSPTLRVNIYNQTKSTKFIKFSKYTA